jgi:hypothetical protein
MRLQARWSNELTEGIAVGDIETTRTVITALRKRLDAGDAEDQF